jgi:L-fucose isomerase-like protein
LAQQHRLNGLTIRCFDLLTAVHNTGCLALAKLSSEGIVSGCEGDVPALLTMVIGKALTGITGFQANPARVDIATGELVFAHCTIPFSLVERYELDTHFESGIGVGIRGFMKEGPVTVFKVSADLSRYYAEEGFLVENMSQPNMCRTQQLIRLCNPEQARYFLTSPIGNHHVIIPGHHKRLIDDFMSF